MRSHDDLWYNSAKYQEVLPRHLEATEGFAVFVVVASVPRVPLTAVRRTLEISTSVDAGVMFNNMPSVPT